MATEKTIVQLMATLARSAKRTGLKSSSLMLHDATYEQCVDLWADGWYPMVNTVRRDYQARHMTYWSMTKYFEGVGSITVFTVDRDATAAEIAAVTYAVDPLPAPAPTETVEAPPPIEVNPPRPTLCTDTRWSFVEID